MVDASCKVITNSRMDTDDRVEPLITPRKLLFSVLVEALAEIATVGTNITCAVVARVEFRPMVTALPVVVDWMAVEAVSTAVVGAVVIPSAEGFAASVAMAAVAFLASVEATSVTIALVAAGVAMLAAAKVFDVTVTMAALEVVGQAAAVSVSTAVVVAVVTVEAFNEAEAIGQRAVVSDIFGVSMT